MNKDKKGREIRGEDVTIQVPVGIAATVCDVNANVLAQQIAQTGSAECDAAVEQNL